METAVAANDDEDIKAMLLNVMEAPANETQAKHARFLLQCQRKRKSKRIIISFNGSRERGLRWTRCRDLLAVSLCLVRLVSENLAYDFSNE